MDFFGPKFFWTNFLLTKSITAITTTTTKTLMGFDTIEINLVFLIFTFQSISCIPIFPCFQNYFFSPKRLYFLFFLYSPNLTHNIQQKWLWLSEQMKNWYFVAFFWYFGYYALNVCIYPWKLWNKILTK